MTELSANDVKFISVDRQNLDLLKYITYGTVHSIFVGIQPDSTKKNDLVCSPVCFVQPCDHLLGRE